ncbi:MAG: 6-phospho-beta-glucosidase [Chloroflexi bacterium]|nr:6-phospho-beta-glucosidase [Chloroflexota bacterium]
MKITVIGGGSTYAPELADGLLNYKDRLGIEEITLQDIDPERLETVGGLVLRMARKLAPGLSVTLETDQKKALKNADFVISQVRVGGQEARLLDETVPLKYGVIGQETTGPGGMFKAFRTLPVMTRLASDMEKICPGAALINFTNPSGLITRGITRTSSIKVIGLCNIPIVILDRLGKRLEVSPDELDLDYFGLNHLSFVGAVYHKGIDRLPEILKKSPPEEFPPEMVRSLGLWPSYYLRYYYLRGEMLKKARRSKPRAYHVKKIEDRLLELYKRPALYKKPALLNKRGGKLYSAAAEDLIIALSGNLPRTMVLNVRNEGALPDLPYDSVVEVPVIVSKKKIRRNAGRAMPVSVKGLIQQVDCYEELALAASFERSRDIAVQALTAHPLVVDYHTACKLTDDLLKAHKKYLEW